jgi:hypothetical protein
MRRFILLIPAAATIASLALASPPSSLGATMVVQDAAQFASAVAQLRGAGGTIVLRPHRYTELVVPPRGPRRLTITAQRGVSVGRLVLCNTQSVTVRGLLVAPRGRHAQLYVCNSRSIRFERLSVRGGRRLRANGSILNSSGVTFADSAFTRCGEGRTPEAGYCLRLRENHGLAIVSSRFFDCYGCDFIHGHGNAILSILRNRFDRALMGFCGSSVRNCHHQDLIHLRNGRNVRFDRNRFGIYEYPGAAQIYLNGGIRRVVVTNNLFVGTDPRLPGYRARNAMWIGNRHDFDVPRGVVIKHNTILTGAPRVLRKENFITATSIAFSQLYSRIPVRDRPIVANNVLGLAATPYRMCEQVQASITNVILNGKTCGPTDVLGNAGLDANGRPTDTSTLLIDRANRRYATPYDLDGVQRGKRPDIGAYEYARR